MKEVVVVSGVRLPVGSYGGSLKDITAIDMGAMVVKEAVKRAGIQPSDVDEVVIGQVGEVAENGFIARAVSLKAGMPKETTAYSVNRQCGSGLQSIAEAVMEIQTGQADVVVAGGTENISRLPYYVNDARWGARMGHKVFEDGVIDILTWPLDGNHNGVTAENVAEKYHVTREEQDAFAVRSHQRACKAIKEGKFKDEILPVELKDRKGNITIFDTDEGPREGQSMEKLAKLRPCFVKGGTVTAANSSSLNDGAAAVVVMSKEKAEELKKKVQENAARMEELSAEEKEVEAKIKKDMMVIPNIIDPSVPIGKDDSQNVEIEKFGEPVVPDFEIPYHTEIMEKFNGIDLESAGKVAGNGFYYLMGDIARLHSAVISYARDFMIDRGFTYCIPPFMIRSNVVTGVMSFAEMDSMMYKIEGEDLYLIGTSEHSMIGKFIDTMLDEAELPKTLTSYSPCFRKEKGAHGIEERGVYRIHQFEKQEMIVVCKPEESKEWYDKLWKNTVDLFRSLDIPVRTLECCSGDLADLKVKSCDVEAWSPRQKKYFEVGSCSNLGDAQARRLGIRVKGSDGNKYFAHTLNNTVVAPPRMLIAFLENNLQADGSVRIPEVLRPYMGGKSEIR